MIGAECIKRAADAVIQQPIENRKKKGNKEKGMKARVELRERPAAVRCTR